MIIQCDKCRKETEAVVTKAPPHKVMCQHCHAEIEGINKFTVASLVREKKFAVENKKSFTFFCDHDKEHIPGILKKDAQDKYFVACTKCSNKMNVSEFMINQMKELTAKSK